MKDRVQRLRQQLATQELGAFLVSTPENRRYLSGFTGTAAYLVIAQEHAFIATDFRYWEQVSRQAPDFELVKVTSGDISSWLPDILQGMGPATLGFEANYVTYTSHEALKKAIRSMKPAQRPRLVPTQDFVESLRLLKEPQELEVIGRAIAIADHAFEEVSTALKPGMTERQIAWLLEQSMREQGAESLSFDLIVASGPNAALPHHPPGDRPIRRGESIIIDMGARLDGYCSDLSRTVYLGTPDDRYKRVYDLVLSAQETAIAAVQSGMTGHEGDKLARDVIEQAGFGEQFGHGTGHGVGLAIHESPRVARRASDPLRDGMVFTIEPGIYIPGWGGVRIEDIVVLERGRARNLTKAPKVAW